MPAGEFNHLRHLGFSHFVGEYATNADPMTMDVQHDLDRLVARLIEKVLKDMHHEFHGGVIVVEQQHLVEVRTFRPGAGFRGDAGRRPGPSGITALIVVALDRNGWQSRDLFCADDRASRAYPKEPR